MKHLILGTAGHVDHGKTSLVKALTGVDTDRLPEEKLRGMTIELGFTHMSLPSGITLGVVDMPGHEKFIKHMAAGAGGVDIALLIVAADEGIMRQTEEHLEILDLLGIRSAVIAITKSDLVDGEWIEMVSEEVKERLSGGHLADSPIVAVSSVTGEGIEALVSAIDEAAQNAAERKSQPAFRIYIDRVFTMTGHGTVVTGTLLGSDISEGDRMELLPGRVLVKAKHLEVHDSPVQRAEPGQRVALNITGGDKAGVDRGMALASPGWLEPTKLIDVRIEIAQGMEPIEHNERLRLHIGTSEAICRARVPKAQPDAHMLMQLETESFIYPARGDRFVIRTYSPSRTAGGGIVLCSTPPRRKIGSPEETASLARLADTDDRVWADELVRTVSRAECGGSCAWPLEEDLLRKRAFLPEAQFAMAFGSGRTEGPLRIEQEGGTYLIDSSSFEAAREKAKKLLSAFHESYPLRRGMPKEELRQRLMPASDRKRASALLDSLQAEGSVHYSEDCAHLPGKTASLTQEQRRTADILEELFRESMFSPPDLAQAAEKAGPMSSTVADYLIEEGTLIKTSEEIVFHKAAIDEALKAAAAFEGPFTAAMLRDALSTSRKFAIAILEWMDSQDHTQRSGDNRVFKARDRG